MRNKILIGVALLLIVFVFAVRYLFKEKLEVFKSSISQYELAQLENFRKEKEKRVSSISMTDNSVSKQFVAEFDETKALTEHDTTFSFLYLSEEVKYKLPSLKYIDCLNNKCVIDKQNTLNKNLIKGMENELERKFGKTFSIWYPQFKDSVLIKKSNAMLECDTLFPESFAITYDIKTWNDFADFLVSYNSTLKKSEIDNRQVNSQYEVQKARTRSQLNGSGIRYFESKLSDSEMLSTDSETILFRSPTLGLIDYKVEKRTINQARFQNIVDEALLEQWKYNSLPTGSMPYGYCYGRSNYCNSYGCSKISVRAGYTDVLVTIKDDSRDVVRHAYVNAGHTYTFEVTDGRYQVFFYCGKGWNPNKFMTTSFCGTLKGGFVSDEDFTKDDYISLYSQIMTYELIMQPNGNLSTQPSSMSEAFK